MAKKVGVLVGSLRKEFFNRKVAHKLMALAPATLKLHLIDIAPLSLYNQDLDETPPTTWVEFRKEIKTCDAILFFTPEYNRSLPAVLKNAIDIASRPYGQSVWKGKPAGIVSVSLGAAGGFGANHHLRQSLVFLDMPCLQQPEAYIGQAHTLFDKQGELTNESTLEFLQKYINAYAAWVEKF